MTHVRATIRQAFTQGLQSLLPAGSYEMLGVRVSKRNRDNHTPDAVIDVRFTGVNISQQSLGDDRAHSATLMIRVTREAPEDALSDMLDQDEVLISNAVNRMDWSALLEDEPELVEVSFAYDGESNVTIGAIMLRYTVEYRINKRNPEQVRA